MVKEDSDTMKIDSSLKEFRQAHAISQGTHNLVGEEWRSVKRYLH